MSLKPTCKEVHRLVSEGLDRDLSLVERARMQMHLLVCRACQNFNGQMLLLRKAMRNFRIPDLSAGSSDGVDRERP
jgi:predicted anti-sigma-YlaC factor YlaD